MAQQLLAGKSLTIDFDEVDFLQTPIDMPNADPTNVPVPFTLTNWTEAVQTFTNAPGSARTDAGTAMTGYFRRLNNNVQAHFEFGNLEITANAVATALLTFNETVPLTFRPSSVNSAHLSIGVIANGVEAMATLIISNAGVVTIGLGSGLGTFTIAQTVGVNDQSMVEYLGRVPI